MRHSEIRKSFDLLWIRDLKSTNGTYVNQNKIKVKRISASNSDTAGETMCATLSGGLDDLSRIEPQLRKLICKRQVIPHFQPLLRFSDMTEIGYEILGRIENKDLPSNVAELLDIENNLEATFTLS